MTDSVDMSTQIQMANKNKKYVDRILERLGLGLFNQKLCI